MLNSALRGAIAAGDAAEPEQLPDLPFFGRFYGAAAGAIDHSAANSHIRWAGGVTCSGPRL
jgi:hypothetical protein